MATGNSINSNKVSSNFHTVPICPDLPEIKKYYKDETLKDLPPTDYWIRKMAKKGEETHYKVQHVMVNGPYTTLIENHPIFAAFLFAYNSHEDIVLSPDDIWLMIRIYFCQYINDNAEKLRALFVDHTDKKILTIVQVGMAEIEWDGDYVNGGWILRLCYGLRESNIHHVTDLKLPSLVVPVQVNNEVTNQSKMCNIVGRFHGVQSCDGRHKPMMGFAIIDDLRTITHLKLS
ncbi:unnamed protein product [Rotaria sp. Silwood2]|nr:unnamed protein product [Rotaria sp. Silwood2]CAF4256207.1 unnamed protein product [Rotaria sp. Silwood2]